MSHLSEVILGLLPSRYHRLRTVTDLGSDAANVTENGNPTDGIALATLDPQTSALMDGTGDYYTYGSDPALTTTCTVLALFRTTGDVFGDLVDRCHFDSYPSGLGAVRSNQQLDGGGTKWALRYDIGGEAAAAYLEISAPFTGSDFADHTFLVAVRCVPNGGNYDVDAWAMRDDGTIYTHSHTSTVAPVSTANWTWGRLNGGNDYKGNIQEVAIFKASRLTDAQLTNIADAWRFGAPFPQILAVPMVPASTAVLSY